MKDIQTFNPAWFPFYMHLGFHTKELYQNRIENICFIHYADLDSYSWYHWERIRIHTYTDGAGCGSTIGLSSILQHLHFVNSPFVATCAVAQKTSKLVVTTFSELQLASPGREARADWFPAEASRPACLQPPLIQKICIGAGVQYGQTFYKVSRKIGTEEWFW